MTGLVLTDDGIRSHVQKEHQEGEFTPAARTLPLLLFSRRSF